MARVTEIPKDLESTHFDVIIIGAGINGSGIARDAAMRGLKVLLLEKEDIASGTSSRSARMIHGGLRYLKHAELGLVRESLQEREHLLQIAPHLVKSKPLIIPFYSENEHPGWQVRLGLLALDLLSIGDNSLEWHKVLSKEEALQHIPSLNPQGLRGAAMMPDAYSDNAERLCLENVLSAQDNDTVVITHARVNKILLDGQQIKGVAFVDELNHQEWQVQASLVINVAGPWVDSVLEGIGKPIQRFIGGIKGSHIVIKPFNGAPQGSVFFENLEDHRPVIITPWKDMVLIGTTDIRFEQDADCAIASPEEIDYLLRETNRLFPEANLSRDSILFTYSGVRPLPYVDETKTASITRRHFIHNHAPDYRGLFSIIGGKLTTYRNLAEETVDTITPLFDKSLYKCRTHLEALSGAYSESFPQELEHDFDEATIKRLLSVYGKRSLDVLAIVKENESLRKPLSNKTNAIGAEVIMAFRHELAETLTDVLIRRLMLGFSSNFDREIAENAANVAQEYFGWDLERKQSEIQFYLEYSQRFGVSHGK